MKKFNLFKEIIVVQKIDLLKAINTSKEFAITISGEIKQEPFASDDIFIFLAKQPTVHSSILAPQIAPSITSILGKNYQVVEDDERILIKAFSNWQELIKINTPRASYDDTTGDGVCEFSSANLEAIGWNATEFNITYRDLVEELEEKCHGVLLCIEQETPYQFSGLGYIQNDDEAKKILLSYCQNKIKKLMENDEAFAKENLTDDELEAAQFFKLA